MMKTVLFAIIAVFFGASGLWYTITSNFDFGDFLVWCIAIASLLYALFHRQIDLFTKAGFGFVCKIVFFLGCGLFLAVLLFILAGQVTNKASGNANVLIVLGCFVDGEAPSAVLTYRLDEAYTYYSEHPDVTIVVSGGQGPTETVAEAQVMQKYLLEKGVPESQLLVEDQSSSTEENFRFSKILLEENGFVFTDETEIVYVTNGFHCARAACYAIKEGFTAATALPAGMPISQIITCYLREVFAVVYYAVFKSPNVGFLKNYVGLLAIFGKG